MEASRIEDKHCNYLPFWLFLSWILIYKFSEILNILGNILRGRFTSTYSQPLASGFSCFQLRKSVGLVVFVWDSRLAWNSQYGQEWLELLTRPPPPPKCWDYEHASPHPVYMVLGLNSGLCATCLVQEDS